MLRRFRTDGGNASGNAAVVVVIILLIVAGVGFFFLFRGSSKVELPPAGNVSQEQNGAALTETVDAKSAPAASMELGADSTAVSGISAGMPLTATGEVDWNARYQQLKTQYTKEFQEPKIGMNTTIELNSGTIVKGRISDLTDSKITVRVGEAKATYLRTQLSPRSQLLVFRDVYGAYRAKQAVIRERAAADPADQE